MYRIINSFPGSVDSPRGLASGTSADISSQSKTADFFEESYLTKIVHVLSHNIEDLQKCTLGTEKKTRALVKIFSSNSQEICPLFCPNYACLEESRKQDGHANPTLTMTSQRASLMSTDFKLFCRAVLVILCLAASFSVLCILFLFNGMLGCQEIDIGEKKESTGSK